MSMFKWIRGTVVGVSVAATFGAAAQVTPVRYQLCEPDVPPPGTVLNLQTNYRYPASEFGLIPWRAPPWREWPLALLA